MPCRAAPRRPTGGGFVGRAVLCLLCRVAEEDIDSEIDRKTDSDIDCESDCEMDGLRGGLRLQMLAGCAYRCFRPFVATER